MVRNPFKSISVKISGDSSALAGAVDNAIVKLNSLSKTAAIASGAIAGIGAAGIAKSVSSFADFDAAMTESMAIMGDVSETMEQDMVDAAQDVAETTQFSAEQAAESYFFLASAGMDAQESMESLTDVAEFAQAGMFDMSRATDILTDAQSALGLEVSELTDLSDKLVTANTLANASVEQFGEALINKTAPAMDRLGVSVDEGISALSVFADQGLKGRRAGTIFARTLENLSEKAQDNSEAFEELGVSVFNAEGEMRSIEDIIRDFEDALGGMSTQQREAALSQLGFNSRAQQGIDILMGNSDQLAEYTDELENAGGTTEEVADKQLDTLNAQFDLLTDRLNVLAIEIGSGFEEPVRGLVKVVNTGIERVTDFVDSVDNTRLAMASAGGVISSLGFTIARFVSGPIGLALTVAPLLAKAWKENVRGIRDAAEEAFERITGFIEEHRDTVRDAVSTAYEPIGNAIETVSSHVESLAQTFGILNSEGNVSVDGIVTAFGALTGPIGTALSVIWRFRDNISEVFETVQSDVIEPFVEGFKSAFNTDVDTVIAETSETFSVIQETIEDVFDDAIDVLEDFGDPIEDLMDHSEEAGEVVGEAFESVGDVIEDVNRMIRGDTGVEGMESTISDSIGSIEGIFENVQSVVNDFIRDIGRIWEQAKPGIDNLKEGIKDAGPAIANVAESILGAFKGFTDFVDNTVQPIITDVFQSFVIPLFNDLADVVAEDLGPTLSEIGDTIDALAGHVRDLHDDLAVVWDHIDGVVVPIAEALGNTIRNSIVLAIESAIDVLNLIMNVIQGDFDEALENTKDLIGDLFGTIPSTLENIGRVTLDVLEGIGAAVVSMFEDVADWLITDAPGILASAIESAVDAMIDVIVDFGEWLIGGSKIQEIFNDVADWLINSAVGLIGDAIGDVIDAILSPFKSIAGIASGAYDAVTGIVDTAMGGIRSTIDSAKGMIGDVAGAVARTVLSPFKSLAGMAGGAIDAIGGVVDSAMSTVRSTISNAKSGIESAADTIASGISGAFSGMGVAGAVRSEFEDAAEVARQHAEEIAANIPGVSASDIRDKVSDFDDSSDGDEGGTTATTAPGTGPVMHTGGKVERGGRAILEAGEQVIPAAEVDRSGSSVVDEISLASAVVDGMREVMAEMGDGSEVVVHIGEREVARANRRGEELLRRSEINR